ncbi:MAG: DNA repair protein RadA [Actinomycetota bacterium]|nr:DNA repair protein RadA [Actinomycetota bacterium]
MSKAAAVWRCQDCGSMSPKWLGRCPDCGQFNTFTEEKVRRAEETTARWIFSSDDPRPLSGIDAAGAPRRPTGIAEFDRVLGGGIVAGSLVLLGGEPGVGKSTLMMQAAGRLALDGLKVLMVSGEESIQQVKLRATRLNITSDNLLILAEIAVDQIQLAVEKTKPDLLIVDSIQTLYHPEISSAPGSVSQVRECAGHLMRLGKGSNIPVFLIGHVTKEGAIAGPRLLEHMVDTVLYFDGGQGNSYRLVRAVKNRFGASNELAVFAMGDSGLVEVDNPSALFLSERPEGAAGSIVAATIEGTRPLLVELQALVTPTYLSMPRRLTSGVDHNRAMLTLAVLERRAGARLDQTDVYINIAGGVKANEPALDLPLALAVVSAGSDKPIEPDLCAFGEIGLAGEIRFVSNVEDRIKEAAKLGFTKIIMPDQKPPKKPADVKLIVAKTLQAALEQIS